MPTPAIFGCPHCFDAPAAAFAQAWQDFPEIACLIDESHYIVRIAACPRCGQRWLSIFTETIDWQDGDDPQYRSILPLTAEEAQELLAAGENVSQARIMELGRQRRYLQMDHPTGKPPRVCWAQGGLLIGPHD